jgi:hypothetical protein
VVKALLLCVAEADFIPEEVYVVVTVSVTPVGNVVILGVGVPSFDGDTDLETVAEEHRESRSDGLYEADIVIKPEADTVFDIRAVDVCLALDETVVEDDCDLLPLAEGVYDTEALGVFELLADPETVAEAPLLLDDLGLNVEDGVAVSAGDPVGLSVSFALGPVVAEPDATAEELLLSTTVAVIVFVPRSVNDILLLTDDEAETLGVFVCVAELETDTEMMGVRVSLIDAVPHVDALEVFEGGVVLVRVVEADAVFVGGILCVAVLVGRVEPVIVVLPVEVRELDTLRDPLGDPVEVFDDDTDCVSVADTTAVLDPFVVFVNDGDAEEVFDEAIVLV